MDRPFVRYTVTPYGFAPHNTASPLLRKEILIDVFKLATAPKYAPHTIRQAPSGMGGGGKKTLPEGKGRVFLCRGGGAGGA